MERRNAVDVRVHVPVLTGELLEHLHLAPGARCIDATIDGGGHTRAILERTAPDGTILGIDRDSGVLSALDASLGDALRAGRLRAVNGNFRELAAIAAAHDFTAVDAIIFDLGVSSYHFDVSGRGFTFMRDEPLDMRFDPDEMTPTAADLLATRGAEELAALFRELGEERFAGRIAQRIARECERMPVRTTERLYELIAAALPARVRWRSARSAARVFQGLRIAVNDELTAIREALPQALSLLAPGGRLAVIAFHSLEDRIVKQFFVSERQAGRVRILTKKPIRPTEAEIIANPRASSAKLRVCERGPITG